MGRHISQVAFATPYDNTVSGIPFNNVNDAITYLLSVVSENFSYNVIALGETITVPIYQQMIVFQSLTITGSLVLDGAACLI